jgi:hypothetical protein
MSVEPLQAEQPAAKPLSVREAVVGLLIASARADGSVSPQEANQIEHAIAAMRLFRGCSHEAREAVFVAVAERIKEEGTDRVARAAAAAIPEELRATTFALAVDLMLSGGRFPANEEHFADELRALLGIDADTFVKIIDVLRVKNAG